MARQKSLLRFFRKFFRKSGKALAIGVGAVGLGIIVTSLTKLVPVWLQGWLLFFFGIGLVVLSAWLVVRLK